MRHKSLLTCFIILAFSVSAAPVFAQDKPIPVSPGAVEGIPTGTFYSSLTPTFHWTGIDQAETYKIILYPRGESYSVLDREVGKTTNWQWDQDPLAAGRDYFWTVQAKEKTSGKWTDIADYAEFTTGWQKAISIGASSFRGGGVYDKARYYFGGAALEPIESPSAGAFYVYEFVAPVTLPLGAKVTRLSLSSHVAKNAGNYIECVLFRSRPEINAHKIMAHVKSFGHATGGQTESDIDIKEPDIQTYDHRYYLRLRMNSTDIWFSKVTIFYFE